MTVPAERAAAFRDTLQPYRPEGVRALDAKGPCAHFATDLTDVRITWVEDGRTSSLLYNFGCDPDVNAALRAAIDKAPAVLGIKGLRAPEADWVASTMM